MSIYSKISLCAIPINKYDLFCRNTMIKMRKFNLQSLINFLNCISS